MTPSTPAAPSAPPAMPSMPSSPSSGSAPSSAPSNTGDSMYDRLGSALSAPDSGPSQTAQPEAQPAAQPDQQTQPDQQAAETSEQPVDATTQATAEDPYAEFDQEGDVDKPTLDTLLQTPRGRQIYQGYKYTRELAKPTHEGGIGHVPTIDQTRTYFQNHAQRVQMDQDYIGGASGDPQAMAQWTDYWFGKREGNDQLTALKTGAAGRFVQALSQINPDAYVEAATPIMGTYLESLWNRYEQAADPKTKEAMWTAYQMVHKDLTGEYRNVNGASASPQEQTGQGDPLAAERAQLQQGFRELMQHQQAQQQARQNQLNSHIINTSIGALYGEVDKAVGQYLKPMKESQPAIYKAAVQQFVTEIKNGVSADPQLWQLFVADLREAQRQGTPQAIQQAVEHYMRLARPVIAAKRKEFLKQAGINIMEQSNGRHAALGQVASHKGPTNGAAPNQQTLQPGGKKGLDESFEAYSARRVKEVLGG